MKRAATEKPRTLRVWRRHLATHDPQNLCACELQPGRFRKSQRIGGCGRAQCWLCHPDKLSGSPTLKEFRAFASYSEGLVEVFLGRRASPRAL